MRLTVGATVAVRELVTADGDPVAVPDPGKALYREFGVEASRRALLDPRAYATIARSIAYTLWEVLRLARQAAPPVTPAAAAGPAQAGNGTG
jgi:hypothetical protein